MVPPLWWERNSSNSIFQTFYFSFEQFGATKYSWLDQIIIKCNYISYVIKLAFFSQKAKYSFFFRSIHFFVYHHQLGTFTTPVENLGSTRPNFVSMPSKIGVATWKPPTWSGFLDISAVPTASAIEPLGRLKS